MEKVSKDVAVEEIDRWLDSKKFSDKKRESLKDSVDTLIDAIVDGTLCLDENNMLIQTLKFPIQTTDGKVAYDKFEYKPRLKMEAIHLHMQGVKSSDADGRVCAYVAALTSKPKDVVKKMDTEDYSVAQSIAVFFL